MRLQLLIHEYEKYIGGNFYHACTCILISWDQTITKSQKQVTGIVIVCPKLFFNNEHKEKCMKIMQIFDPAKKQ